MRHKLMLLGGIGIGYVLGAKAGRGRYEKLKATAERAWRDPRVQHVVADTRAFLRENAPVVQERMSEAASAAMSGTKVAAAKVAEGTRAAMSSAQDAAAKAAGTARTLTGKLSVAARDLSGKVRSSTPSHEADVPGDELPGGRLSSPPADGGQRIDEPRTGLLGPSALRDDVDDTRDGNQSAQPLG